jgi:hypothetical protein
VLFRFIFLSTAPRGRLAGDALVEHLPDVFICNGTRLEEGSRARVLQDGADCPLILFEAPTAHPSLAPVQLKESRQEAGIHRLERVLLARKMLNNAAMLYPLLHSAPVRVDCGVRCFSIASGPGRQWRAGGTKQA